MIKHSQLFKRIVTPYFIMITIVISVSMLVVYYMSIQKIESDSSQSARSMALKTAHQTDAYISELDFLAEQVKRQPAITSAFFDAHSENTENQFQKDILKSIEVSSALKGLLAGRFSEYNICIYNEYGDFVSSQEYLVNKETLAAKLNAINFKAELNQLAQNSAIVCTPAANPWTESETQYITLKKALQNSYSDDIFGIIEIRASVDYMANFINPDNSFSDTVVILDCSSGDVIYPLDTELSSIDSSEYITSQMSMAHWETAVKMPNGITNAYSLKIIAVFVFIYALLLFLLFFITNAIGQYITQPIMQLAKYVRTIDAPDSATGFVEDMAIDEIKELSVSFDKMLERMNHSIQQEKKAYSLALQAQMNPHFLYNMLAVISSAGAEAGCDNVSDMCVRLSEMLRYVASYQNVTVTLKEELAHVRNYLSLMKSRYEDCFDYTIEAAEELLNIPVPKLFIQPLTENCFMHGFREKEPPWKIDITMCGDTNCWQLTIRDNGSGISDDKIRDINKQIENAVSEMTMRDIGGIGIVNTIVRLKITHRNRIDYEIFNDNGAVIHITAKNE